MEYEGQRAHWHSTESCRLITARANVDFEELDRGLRQAVGSLGLLAGTVSGQRGEACRETDHHWYGVGGKRCCKDAVAGMRAGGGGR